MCDFSFLLLIAICLLCHLLSFLFIVNHLQAELYDSDSDQNGDDETVECVVDSGGIERGRGRKKYRLDSAAVLSIEGNSPFNADELPSNESLVDSQFGRVAKQATTLEPPMSDKERCVVWCSEGLRIYVSTVCEHVFQCVCVRCI